MKKKVHVVHHTHWDFEWYFTNNESFIQLTYHLDEVMNALENNMIDYYLLDGQMSILDEYLESFPEQKKRIKSLVQSNKLLIGPWYTQTDELIVRGESILRNLTLGIDLAEDLGGYMNIGYLPDSFGQGKDMPKIYNGLNIEKSVFWRGVPSDITNDREFYWKAEDDTKVLVSNIRNGYFVGVGLIYDENYHELMNAIENGATTDQLILPVGGDQRYVDYNLRERIELYNQHLNDDYELIESTYDQFFESLDTKDLITLEGEFISSSASKIHRSIYSSRYDHKYLNDKIERRMIYQLEPLMVMADKIGIPYKKGVLDRIWKLLSKNQAHDSAGGCNSDKTNKIILDRFIEADQLSYSIVDYLTRKISESRETVKENELLVFNTLPWSVKKVVEVEISSMSESIIIMEGKKVVPHVLLNSKKEYNGSIRRLRSQMDEEKFYYIHKVAIEVEIPSLNYSTYQVNHLDKIKNENKLAVDSSSIENDFYKVSIVEGKVNIFNKKLDQLMIDVLSFENSGDEGDTYDYSPAYEDDFYNLDLSESKVYSKTNELLSTLTIKGKWFIAANLTERANKQRSMIIPYELIISLKKESKNIECHLVIENKACDHRMRVLINTPISSQYSYTDTPFGTIKREVEDKNLHNWKELGWREEPTAIYPMLSHVNLHNKNLSTTVFAKGIKEYQVIGDKFNTIALTLYRSVGFLGRPDLIRRPGIASGNEFKYVPTPDSQLLQALTFKFAINFEREYQPAAIQREYFNYALSLPYYQIQELNRFTTTLKYFVSNPLLNKIKKHQSIELVSDNLVYSSYRKTDDSASFDIRIYNPLLDKSVNGGYILTNKTVNSEFVNLKGDLILKINNTDKIDLGIFKPGEIKTVRIYE